MATYLELFDLQNDDDLLHKVVVAVTVAADAIRSEPTATANHAKRLAWAGNAFADPRVVGRHALWAVLAANKDVTTSQIMGAADAQIQAAVDAAVDVLSEN